MAYYSLKATIFIGSDGVAFTKARKLTDRERKLVFIKNGGVCCECKSTVRFGGTVIKKGESCLAKIRIASIDHIFPISRGGQNNDENLRLLCKNCNSQKGAKDAAHQNSKA